MNIITLKSLYNRSSNTCWMSSFIFRDEDYLKAEIIRLKRENEILKRRLEQKLKSQSRKMCGCGNGLVYMKGMCLDCCGDYGI